MLKFLLMNKQTAQRKKWVYNTGRRICNQRVQFSSVLFILHQIITEVISGHFSCRADIDCLDFFKQRDLKRLRLRPHIHKCRGVAMACQGERHTGLCFWLWLQFRWSEFTKVKRRCKFVARSSHSHLLRLIRPLLRRKALISQIK